MAEWRHIKINRLAWFCNQAPERLRWRMQIRPGGNKLEVVLPRGHKLDFKINGGCWVKKQEIL